MVKYLIDQGADVNAQEEERDGMLSIDSAIRHNDVVLAELLIDNGFEIDTIYYDGNLLWFACIFKHRGIPKLMLDRGADPNAHYPSGNSLRLELIIATCHDHTNCMDTIALLFEYDVDVNVGHAHTGETPLMYAAVHLQVDVVRLLLEHGADVTQVDSYGDSVLDMLDTETPLSVEVVELCKEYIDSNRPRDQAILK